METFSAEVEMCVFGIQTVAGAQPATEPELHFKSQQAARSSAVSQFLRQAAGGRAAAPTQRLPRFYRMVTHQQTNNRRHVGTAVTTTGRRDDAGVCQKDNKTPVGSKVRLGDRKGSLNRVQKVPVERKT